MRSVTASVSSWAIVLSCPINNLLLQTSCTLSPYNFSVPSSQWSLGFRGGDNINVPFIAEHHTVSLGTRWLVGSLGINDHLTSDAQLLRPPIVRSYREPTALCQTKSNWERKYQQEQIQRSWCMYLASFSYSLAREEFSFSEKKKKHVNCNKSNNLREELEKWLIG